MSTDDMTMSKNEARSRYEAHLDGELVGYASYRESGDLVVIPYTEVDRAYGGRGIGGELVRYALEDIRAAGGAKVVPQCGFVRSWIAQHPEYHSLLA